MANRCAPPPCCPPPPCPVYVPGPPGPVGPAASITWKPGAQATRQIVPTWAEVQAYITANQGRIIVYVDNSISPAIIPSTVIFDCEGRVAFSPLVYFAGVPVLVEIIFADGAQLINILGIFGPINLTGAPTVRPFLKITIALQLLLFREGGGIRLLTGATLSALTVDADSCILVGLEGAKYDNSLVPLIPLINIGSLVTNVQFVSFNLPGSTGLSPTFFGGGNVTTILFFALDSTVPGDVPTQTSFLGTQGVFRYQYAGRLVPAAGDTISRPLDTLDGQIYFDTDLRTLIVRDQTPGWTELARKFSQTIGDGVTDPIIVTHNFNTNDVQVEVYNNTPPYQSLVVKPLIERPTPNQVSLDFSATPLLNEFRVVIIG